MKCECCHKQEATIHLTQVIEGHTKKLNLCEKCAEKNGIDINSPISITDVLLGLGAQPPSAEAAADQAFDLSCSHCQMTRAEFKKRARLGCPECYEAFIGELNALTKAMHHGSQHMGKIPARQGKEARITAQIAAMQKDIEVAIAKENYEEAAALRDRIKALKGSIQSAENGE
jgi:protein arginine kinase activator